MMGSSGRATMITIERIGPDGDRVLRNLYEHYVHDMSEWLAIDVRADGAFAYDTASIWDAGDAVFLARVGVSLAGFCVAGSAGRWLGRPAARDVRDLFVLRRYRHQGVGDALAAHMWNAFRAEWLVRVLAANRPAVPFWRRVVSGYTGGAFEERAARDNDRDWIHLRFDNSGARR
jgi:predicted acetyltransferase